MTPYHMPGLGFADIRKHDPSLKEFTIQKRRHKCKPIVTCTFDNLQALYFDLFSSRAYRSFSIFLFYIILQLVSHATKC